MSITQVIRQYLKEIPWLLLLAVLLFRTGIAEASWIPSGSMEPTLTPGDVLVVDKTAYGLGIPFVDSNLVQWATPERGDIVTFDPQHTSDRLIKRVIGVAGDSIVIRNGVTYVNGQSLARAFQRGKVAEQLNGYAYLTTKPGARNFGPVTVPEGHLFVMGDNRANSADSRYWGFLPVDRVKGKARYRLFSTAWFTGSEVEFGSLYSHD